MIKALCMKKITVIAFSILISVVSIGQKIETIYLDPHDSTSYMYLAVIPEGRPIKAFMFLLDGFGGGNPGGLLVETKLPLVAARSGILTIIPVLKTGRLYFG